MATLQAALKNAIQVCFQLEDSELAAEPLPSAEPRNQILIYESAEGGAGVLRRLVEDGQTALIEVAKTALELAALRSIDRGGSAFPKGIERGVRGGLLRLLDVVWQPVGPRAAGPPSGTRLPPRYEPGNPQGVVKREEPRGSLAGPDQASANPNLKRTGWGFSTRRTSVFQRGLRSSSSRA